MGIDLSIIVPLFNEEDNVRPLYGSIRDVVRTLPWRCEIILIDDGSRDSTFARAEQLPIDDGFHLRLIKLRKNCGQTAAMACGIDHARGRMLVTMDGDLQNDPRDIPGLLAELDRGFDIVVGWRHRRQDHVTRVLPSRVANWLIGKVTGIAIRDNGCSLKAYRADVIKNIPLYSEMHRFIPAMSSLADARIAEIKVRHHPRRYGQSKYGFARIYKVLADLLAIRTVLSFSQRPTAWLGGLAMVSFIISLICLVLAFAYSFSERSTPNIVFPGLCVLFGALGIFGAFLGLLNHLIYTTRIRRLLPFQLMSARPGLPADGSS